MLSSNHKDTRPGGCSQPARANSLLYFVNLGQGDTGPAILAGNDRSILARGQHGKEETRFLRIRQAEPVGGQQSCRDRVVLPVVVGGDERSVRIAQLKGGIFQDVPEEVSERWPKSTHRQFRRIGCV